MCSEIDRFSASFLRRMSGNIEKKQEIISSESETTAAQERETEILESDHQNDETEKPTVNSHSRQPAEDDDDGFKTPTSSDHRIPPITHCPPAPKKPRPPPSNLKRKAPSSPPETSRGIQLQLDSSAEVESIFCPIAEDQDDTQQQKVKKPRTDD